MSAPNLPIEVRTNPPADVQQTVAAAIQACHAWRPAEAHAPIRATVESGVCDLIDDWPVHVNAAAYEILWFGAFCGAVGFLFFRMAYRTTCRLYQIVRVRIGRKARSV